MDQSPPSTSQSLGSLHAMRLGAQTLNELAGLVNWSNHANFAPAELYPWVDIETTPTAALTRPTAATQQPNLAQPEAPQTDTTDGSLGGVAEAVPLAHATEPEAGVELESHPDILDDSGSDAQIVESTSGGLESKQATEPESAADSAGDEQAAIVSDAPAVGSDSKAAEVERQAADAAPKPDPIDNEPPESIRSGQKPIPSKASPMPLGTSTMKTDKQPDIDSTEYLRRLEMLVLGLNAQLAQQAGADAAQPQDELTWLRQRVIDLSLHNLELQEKLTLSTS